MAEYQEIIKQQMRMHRYYTEGNGSCDGCPIDEEDLNAICDGVPCGLAEKDLERVEKLVMKWAEEHDEPVYPTWTEYFRAKGIFKAGQGHEVLDKLSMEPEIAEKLGVKPKEV